MQRGGGGGRAASCEVRGRGGCGARGGGVEHRGRHSACFSSFCAHFSTAPPFATYLLCDLVKPLTSLSLSCLVCIKGRVMPPGLWAGYED